jgi:hypothetical protein
MFERGTAVRGGPSIKRPDDVPTEGMLRWLLAHGHTASIWEKWIEMSPRSFAFYAQGTVTNRTSRDES